MRNIGRVIINDRILLNWLQFPFGKIIDIKHNESGFDLTEIIIEDDEMPRVEEEVGSVIPNVLLTVTQYQDCSGHKVEVREPIKEE